MSTDRQDAPGDADVATRIDARATREKRRLACAGAPIGATYAFATHEDDPYTLHRIVGARVVLKSRSGGFLCSETHGPIDPDGWR